MRSLVSLSFVLFAAIAAPACGDDDGGDPAVPDAGPGNPDAAPGAVSLGEVVLLEVEDRGFDGAATRRFGMASARIRDGADRGFHQEVEKNDTCRLLKYEVGACDPYCEGVCDSASVCHPWPSLVDAGILTLTGLAGGDLRLEPVPPYNGYYTPSEPPAELFADDAVVRLSAAGKGAMPAFSTETRAVPTLVAEIAAYKITLENGADFVLRWTKAGDPEARVRLTLNSNNQGHGFPLDAIIECETSDATGEIRVPASMIAKFPETDDWTVCVHSDCPRSWLRRYRRSAAGVPGGAVHFDVGSQVQFGVVHELP